jgi:hypothetical protein
MSAEHGTLTVKRGVLRKVGQLPDGTLTLDEDLIAAARGSQGSTEDEFRQNIARARAATPARVEQLWAYLDQELLSREVAADLVRTGRITDHGWESLKELSKEEVPTAPPVVAKRPPIIRPRFQDVTCWLAEFQASAGQLAINFDPLENRDRRFPWVSTARVLDELSTDGWRLAHVSEDRGIDDGADASFVVAACFLLARQTT